MSLVRKLFGASMLVAAMAAGSAAQAAPTCQGGAIKVGAISSITGPADFGEVPNAAKATFDALNAKGGVNGCKIDFTIIDDKADPETAAGGARELVDTKQVVALVGSASLLDCAVNSEFYGAKGVSSIPGVGVDATCFNSPSISAVNVGPFLLSTALLYYASSKLNIDNVCALFLIAGDTKPAFTQAVTNWEKLSGRRVALLDTTLTYSGDNTPNLLKARDAGCHAIVSNPLEPGAIAMVKAADAQKITGITWLFLAPAYTEPLAKALSGTSQPVLAGTEWEPFTDANSIANHDWRAAMTAANQPLRAFSQGGYESAVMFIEVLKGINGPVTRENVTKALQTMKPISNPLVGTPYVFGTGKTHNSSRGTKIVKLEGGKWTVVTPQFVVVPNVND